MSKKDEKPTIEELLAENKRLKLENRGLKKLVNSKRFKFAEKVATGYNMVFPMNTVRRKISSSIGKVGIKAISYPSKRRHEKKLAKIAKMASNYEKVIVIDSIPWDVQLKQRPHHLAEEFSKIGYFVIYLEQGNYFKDYRLIHDGLVCINNYNMLNGFTDNGQSKYLLLPNTSPTTIENIEKAKNLGFQLIYDYIDEFHEDISGDLSDQLRVWGNLKKLKPVLCVVTASRLHDGIKEYLGAKQKIVLAKNAVNTEHFDYHEIKNLDTPSDMKDIVSKNKPIIGFYGALAPWIDYDLLNNVAKKHPEWEFVYIGIDYGGQKAPLNKLKNVTRFGAREYSQLPYYAKDFHCAIIPFKQGEIAKATSPVKLFEYMAAGLPTVCTRDLQECAGYEYVYLAKNDADFEKLLQKALSDYEKEEVREKLFEQGQKNTWAQRAKDIDEALLKK